MKKRYYIKFRKNGFHGAICNNLNECIKAEEAGYIEIAEDDYTILKFNVVTLIKKPKRKQ